MDRSDFVFAPYAADAFRDHPVPIGHGATLSAPHMHAAVAELLKDRIVPGARVLDVGSGSGYLCAVFARMAPDVRVVGIDYVPELVAQSEKVRAHLPLCVP